MALVVTKILVLFVYPLGIALIAGACAFILSFTRRRRLSQTLLVLAVGLLWIAATPTFARWINKEWSLGGAPVDLDNLPQVNVLVLLGGGASYDRIHRAWRAYRAGKAPVIVVSGGIVPWQLGRPEANWIADVLVEMGVPGSALVLEPMSRTTRENAVNTAKLFRQHGWRTGLLVTSGTHMPRALAAFHEVGLDLIPAVTGTNERVGIDNVFDLLPDVGALAQSTSAIKEIIGLQFYRLCGWA